MPYLVLGIALLAGLLLMARWFVSADPKVVVKILKWIGIPLLLCTVVYLLVTGRLGWALMLAPVLLPWLMRMRAATRNAKNFARMSESQKGGSGANTGQKSQVDTKFLRVTLDHDSGEMTGEVRTGAYAGRDLSTMTLPELVDLLNACLMQDPESAKVLETYLDRTQENWRDFVRPAGAADDGEEAPSGGRGWGGRGGSGGSGGGLGQGGLTREESYKILGLEPGATPEEIKAAYHRLMGALHPDKGGSTYLAAKLNEAKDLLLQGR